MAQPAIRLLMTADAVGGVWQYATELAGALAPRGVETMLAVLGPAPHPSQRAVAAAFPGLTIVDTGLPLDWLADEASARHAAAEVAALARSLQADLVHLNSPALAAGQAYRVPVIGVAHGCLTTWWHAARPGEPLDPAFLWHREMMAAGLRACDRVVAPSASFAERLRQVYALPIPPAVVHNGRAAPDEVDHAPGADAVLTAGRLWDEVKNLHTLDAAAALLDVPFHAVGEATAPHGETRDAEHLVLLGHLDAPALAARLARRPVFVSAATFEPFGLAVLEAAGTGCPLVLSDIPTFRELWDGAAVFVAPHDAPGFAAAVGDILRDPQLRETLGAAARARALTYAPERMASAMIELYGALVGVRLAA